MYTDFSVPSGTCLCIVHNYFIPVNWQLVCIQRKLWKPANINVDLKNDDSFT